MLKTVIGLFDSQDQAEKAASELRGSGFENEVSILAADKHRTDRQSSGNQSDDDSSLLSSITSGGNQNQNNEGSGNLLSSITTGSGGEESGGAGNLTSGVTTGGVLGGLAGLGLGAGALAIPGIGPIIAAGPIAGLVSGALSGGVAGGLVDWGIPAERGQFFEEQIKEGKVLATVRTDQEKINSAADIMRRNGAQNVEVH